MQTMLQETAVSDVESNVFVLPLPAVSHKVCTKCHCEKPVTDFYKPKRGRNKPSSVCKDCLRAQGRGYRERQLLANPEEFSAKTAAAQKKYKSSIKGKAKELVTSAHVRHRKGDWQVPFDLTPAWAERKLKAGFCEATGIRFVLDGSASETRMHRHAPSIDRVDPTRGYTSENSRVVIWQHNAAKGQWSEDDALRYAEALLRKQKPELFAHETPRNGLLN